LSATGYIKNGVYYRTKQVPVEELSAGQQTMWKQGDHGRQRFDHAAEIIQPYLPNGDPNPAMIEAWPEDAKRYGFLPTDPNDVMSPEAIEAARPAEGAKAWGE
jgi:hypothetical protein